MRSKVPGWSLLAVLVVVMLVASGQAGAQPSMSAPLAAELAEALTAADLGAVAARDAESGDRDRFVAALAFPGQLLVVSSRYEAPIYVVQKIDAQQFRDVYIDLNAASIAGTKILVTDVGADGLAAGDGSVDVYDDGSRVIRFDGNPGGQSLSQQAYDEAFAEADAQYSRMLQALLAQVR
jgi:hypothetical protein